MIQTTMNLRAIESILDLNNHAVSYLCQGNHSATTSTLRAAIRSLETYFQQEAAAASCCGEPPKKKRRRTNTSSSSSSSPTVATSSAASIPSAAKLGYVPIRSITVSGASSSDDLPSSFSVNDDTSLLMVYDRAFDFPSLKEEIDFTSQQSKTRLAAILLYNLGLAYQREASRTGKSADLSMALKFYREAYMVLKSAWAKSDFQEVFVLLLALLNNMACIHAYMSDNKDTHSCINWMNRAIASRQRSILSKEDYTFFSLNLSVFRGHQLKLASAA